ESWDQPGGRLRLLRSSHNLDDIIVEVPPIAGTLLAFKRSNNSWHGHEPFVGERRVIQFNWLTSQGNPQAAMLRHPTSASFKRLLRMVMPSRHLPIALREKWMAAVTVAPASPPRL